MNFPNKPRKETKGQAVWALKDGFAWNPLLKIPRNFPCPCQSGAKYKDCHLKTMPRAIPSKLAAEYNDKLKHLPSLRFIHDDKEINLENEKADIRQSEDGQGKV